MAAVSPTSVSIFEKLRHRDLDLNSRPLILRFITIHKLHPVLAPQLRMIRSPTTTTRVWLYVCITQNPFMKIMDQPRKFRIQPTSKMPQSLKKNHPQITHYQWLRWNEPWVLDKLIRNLKGSTSLWKSCDKGKYCTAWALDHYGHFITLQTRDELVYPSRLRERWGSSVTTTFLLSGLKRTKSWTIHPRLRSLNHNWCIYYFCSNFACWDVG